MKLLQKFAAYFRNEWETRLLAPNIFLSLSVVFFAVVVLVPFGPRHPTTTEVAFWRSVSPSQRAELYLNTWPHGAFVSLCDHDREVRVVALVHTLWRGPSSDTARCG